MRRERLGTVLFSCLYFFFPLGVLAAEKYKKINDSDSGEILESLGVFVRPFCDRLGST
jgi:hypothetical protein